MTIVNIVAHIEETQGQKNDVLGEYRTHNNLRS